MQSRSITKPDNKLFIAIVLKFLNPARIPICVVVIALNMITIANALKAIAKLGSFKKSAREDADIKRMNAIKPLKIKVILIESRIIFPTCIDFSLISDAIYFVDVTPNPKVANEAI